MAGWRRAVELAMTDEEIERLTALSRSRTEPASRVSRAQILLAYRENPSFCAVGQRVGVHHQTVQRCVERALGPQNVACARAGSVSELILHPAERRMLPVLDLDPAIVPAAAINTLAVLRNHAFQPEQAGMPEQIRADFALLEIAQNDAVDTPRQQPRQAGLAHAERRPMTSFATPAITPSTAPTPLRPAPQFSASAQEKRPAGIT